MTLVSKLPETGSSIFSVMSNLAREHKAINLAQGFPNFETDKKLFDLVSHYMHLGYNQYAPMPGIPVLREAISNKIKSLYGTDVPSDNITITAGATQAIFTSIQALVHPGDEVIVIEPAYDSYVPSIKLAGGVPVFYQMNEDYTIDWDKLQTLINDKTKLLIINNPHNPSGSVFTKSDVAQLERIIKDSDLYILSDEVYEHMVFDESQHQSILKSDILRQRSLVCFSFGKLFHNTGWKMGYVVAPEKLTAEFRKVHQYEVFSVNTPLQFAFADYLNDENNYSGLSAFFQAKRDLVISELKGSSFKLKPSHGTYFQILDYSAISTEDELPFVSKVTKENGVALIPCSAFYHNHLQRQHARLCFAKTDEMLFEACQILKRL